jgi:hypothetical protein
MESKQRIVAILVAGMFSLAAFPLAADTYRWKDKDGKVHYGAAVPAEYADQPYDVLNDAGMVIDRVEDTSVPLEVIAEKKIKKEREPLISEEERRIQSDRLLVIQYRSEEDITQALELQIGQLGYDKRIIEQSYASTTKAIREQIREAADRQRANQPVSEEQQKGIDQLYARRASDEQKKAAMERRENRIRERFQKDLERYRFLTSGNETVEETSAEPLDQG